MDKYQQTSLFCPLARRMIGIKLLLLKAIIFTLFIQSARLETIAVSEQFMEVSVPSNHEPKGTSVDVSTSEALSPFLEYQLSYILPAIKQLEDSFIDTTSTPVVINVVKTITESYVWFEWANQRNQLFTIEATINRENMVKVLYLQKSGETTESERGSLLHSINSRIQNNNKVQLTDYRLLKVQEISENLQRLFYMNDYGAQYVAFIQKRPFLEIKPLQRVQTNLTPTVVLDFVYFHHGELSRETTPSIEQRQSPESGYGYKQFELDFGESGARVVVEADSYNLLHIIFFNRQQFRSQTSNIATTTAGSRLVGGYQQFNLVEDQPFQAVIEQLYSEFPFLRQTEITNIEYQIISGTNFMITLLDSFTKDQYLSKVFYSLSGEVNIMDLYINSVLIHTRPLSPVQSPELSVQNPSEDPQIIQIKQFLFLTQGIDLDRSVNYVNRIPKQSTLSVDQKTQYEIVYEDKNSYAIVSIVNTGHLKGHIELEHYVEDGEYQLKSEPSSKIHAEVEDLFKHFATWSRPLLIEYLKETKLNEYLCKVITSQGSYFFILRKMHLQSASWKFAILYYELIDRRQFCLTHSPQQLKSFVSSQQNYLQRLFETYGFDSDTQIVSFSEAVINEQIKYRLLAFNPQNSLQAQIFLTENYGALFVEKINALNQGFYQLQDSEILEESLSYAFEMNSLLTEDTQLTFSQRNESHVKLSFIDSKQLYTYTQSFEEPQQNLLKTISFSDSNLQSFECLEKNEEGTCTSCPLSQTAFHDRCWQVINGCLKQIGSVCLSCESSFTLKGSQCISECALLY